MKGFIEVKSLSDGSTVLISIDRIKTIVITEYGAFIETDIDGKGRPVGIPVVDNYEQICQKIYSSR